MIHKKKIVAAVASVGVVASVVLGVTPASAAEDHTGAYSCSSGWTLGSQLRAGADKLVRHTRTNGTYSEYRNDSGIFYEQFYRNWGMTAGVWRNWAQNSFTIRTNQCDN